ncbi:MAG: efflux RND transporter periplasmic adaptor subunit [Pseudomonadota bacterium]
MPMKRNIALAVAGALLLVVGGLVAFQGQPQAEGPSPAMEPEVGVITLEPQRVALEAQLAGRTTPYLIAEVRPQVGGIVKKRLFVEGSDVKAGQALYQIDPATYQAALDSAKATLAKAEANLFAAKLKAGRYKDLVAINAVSQQNYDDAFASLKQAEADVAGAKAAQDTARINVEYTRVTSPISGRIGRSSVTQGALVTANQAASLATVQQMHPIYVDVTQSSTELLKLKRQLASGQLKSAGKDKARVKLILEDGSDYPQEGVLQFSDVTVDQGTGAITLRAVFPNPQQELLPGMYVRAILETGVDDQALLVPQRGVTRNNKGEATVLVLEADNRVQMRTLAVERAVGDQWLVNSGVQAGERVIVEGLQKVRPGATAKAVPFVKPAPGGNGS